MVYLTYYLSLVAYDDARNYLYVTGRVKDTVDGVAYNGGNGDIILLQYSNDGTRRLTMLYGTSAYDEGYAGTFIFWYSPVPIRSPCEHIPLTVAVDSDGYILLAGFMGAAYDSETFGGGNSDAYLLKVDRFGNAIWSRLIGSNGDEIAYGGTQLLRVFLPAMLNLLHAFTVALDSSDDVYITGYVQSSINSATYIGSGDIMLVKYSTDGTLQFTQLLGSTGIDCGRDGG